MCWSDSSKERQWRVWWKSALLVNCDDTGCGRLGENHWWHLFLLLDLESTTQVEASLSSMTPRLPDDVHDTGDAQKKQRRRKRVQEAEDKLIRDSEAYDQHLRDIESFDQLIRETEEMPLPPCQELLDKFSAAKFNGYSRYN